MSKHDKDKQGATAVAERDTELHDDDQAAPMPASAAGGPTTMSSQATDPLAEPTELDPGGDIQTPWDQIVGRAIVITRWALAPVSERFANANSYGLFAVLGFYLADDADKKPRFTTTGSQRIVDVVYASILEKRVLPVKGVVVSFQTRGGFTGHRFARPGEAIRT